MAHGTLLFCVLGFTSIVAWAASPPSSTPKAAVAIDVGRCLQGLGPGRMKKENAHCPGFLLDALEEAERTCGDVNGKLAPAAAARVWSFDVNADGHVEYLVNLEEIVDCEGAPSVFSCGSLGCPTLLYERHHGAWQLIGEIYADAMESIEALGTPATGQHRELRVGCQGENPCREYWFYEWRVGQYERERIEVRGFGVNFSTSLHGLVKLAGATALRATPSADAPIIRRYDADTEVAIVGTAEKADYYYVSPCNACESGFVPKSAIGNPH
ncbi:MAG: hypothetical protein ACRETU_05025 [Steroidobacterales bacterium]